MPNRKKHEQFDVFLAKKGVLLPDAQYGEIHKFMDRGVKFFGSNHRELDQYHGKGSKAKANGLRQWLNGKYNVIGQDRATDWLRSGLGHICLDEADEYLPKSYSWEDVFNYAYRLMVRRRWTKARFVPRRKKL